MDSLHMYFVLAHLNALNIPQLKCALLTGTRVYGKADHPLN